MSPTSQKPRPDVTDLTRPFWTAAAEGRLVMQKCARCGTVNFLPKPWCVECGCRDIPWTEMKKTGTVYSYTLSRSVAMNLPGWQDQLPIVLGLVDVDDGARMYAQIKDIAPEDIDVGMRVEVQFEQLDEQTRVPAFRPIRDR